MLPVRLHSGVLRYISDDRMFPPNLDLADGRQESARDRWVQQQREEAMRHLPANLEVLPSPLLLEQMECEAVQCRSLPAPLVAHPDLAEKPTSSSRQETSAPSTFLLFSTLTSLSARLATPLPKLSSHSPAQDSVATPDELEECLRYCACQIKSFRRASLLYFSPEPTDKVREIEEDYRTAVRQLYCRPPPSSPCLQSAATEQPTPGLQTGAAARPMPGLQGAAAVKPTPSLQGAAAAEQPTPGLQSPVAAEQPMPEDVRRGTPWLKSLEGPGDASAQVIGGPADASAQSTEGPGNASALAQPTEGPGNASTPAHATEGLGLQSSAEFIDRVLFCSANLQTVSSFIAALLHSCSVTGGFLTKPQVPANTGLHSLYVSAGLLVFAFADGRHGLYVSAGLLVFAFATIAGRHGLYVSAGLLVFAFTAQASVLQVPAISSERRPGRLPDLCGLRRATSWSPV
ncbi:hypothetical protein CRENBAI_000449 [Crenichthys baileyi]|uniref:Uncharacterized protein n=1 Tax=Crenichthys baileyi TaxID=28760 RepID=A0AAV9QXZ7_9TELE